MRKKASRRDAEFAELGKTGDQGKECALVEHGHEEFLAGLAG
jgi:hypothetical protein